MAEEVLYLALEGRIPISDVLTWIKKGTSQSLRPENVECNRGEFVLSVLSFLRESAAKARVQPVHMPSPIKSIKKSTPVSSGGNVLGRQRSNGKQSGRRIQLFPSPQSSNLQGGSSDKINCHKPSDSEAPRNNRANLSHNHDTLQDGSVQASTPRNKDSSSKPASPWVLLAAKEGKENERKITHETSSPIATSSCASSTPFEMSPQFTPIQKRFHNFKPNDSKSPAPQNSPDLFKRTSNRTGGTGMCLGDFIFKEERGQRQHQKKRFSPPCAKYKVADELLCSPINPELNSSDELHSSNSNKKKHRRRINPTKVVLENSSLSSSGFTENQSFGSVSRPLPSFSPFREPDHVEPRGASNSFAEERNLLKQERLKLQSHGEPVLMQATPTKLIPQASSNLATPTKLTQTARVNVLDPSQVSFKEHLLRLSEIYCCLLDTNLVPNLMTEFYFVLSLLTAQYHMCDNVNDSETSKKGRFISQPTIEEDTGVSEASSETVLGSHNDPNEKLITCAHELDDSKYFCSGHNCVYFVTKVLWQQRNILGLLDRVTLRLLWENERISSFSPELTEYLSDLYSKASSKPPTSLSTVSAAFKAKVNENVAFQSETDNSSNFPSSLSFSSFRKQRDGFYELIRIWESNHMVPGWNFVAALGSRVRSLLQLCSDPVNYMHLARLFRQQLIATVSGESSDQEGGVDDIQFLECLRGVDPEKLNRLRGRLITPNTAAGPRPSPSFPGLQEFYRDFLQAASNSSFLQHVQDGLVSHLVELDQTPFMASDMEECETTVDEATRHGYQSCICTMHVLAKFLGYIVFLPYSRPEPKLQRNIFQTEISLRSKVVPPINILGFIIEAYHTNRLVVTLPWVVKYLGMMDAVSAALPYYQAVFRLLLCIYGRLAHQPNDTENTELTMSVQTSFMLRLILGWFFESPVLEDGYFYLWCPNTDELGSLIAVNSDWHFMSKHGIATGDVSLSALNVSALTNVTATSVLPVDALDLVDGEVLYAVCPFLLELRALLAALPDNSSVPGGSARSRHITPVSTGFSQISPSTGAKQLELQLEESFFHGLPASVHRTVDFVVERVASACVKHICCVWLPGIKEQGLKQLREKIASSVVSSDCEVNSLQKSLLREAQLIVEQVTTELKAKCRSGVSSVCAAKCKGALASLLSEESLSPAVCEMCIAIAARMSSERVFNWMQTHATLSMYSKDLQSEVEKAIKHKDRSEAIAMAKTSHIAPGSSASWAHDESALSPCQILHVLKLLVCNVLDGQTMSKEHIMDVLDKIEESVTKRQDVVPAAERIISSLTVDLVVALVCYIPSIVESSLLNRLVTLWKLDSLKPVEDGLARLVCPRNMLLLAQSRHPPRLVWEKLADVVAAALKAELVSPDLVENQCLAIMQQEWPENILRCFSLCMNEVVRQYQKQKNSDYKFVLLVEWLSETMAQINFFPDL